MKILNGQDAFAALSAGQKIEARHQQATEFDSLDNFPATILVNPEYEFRIALTFITIGEIKVPEPEKEAPAKGVQYFAPSLLTEELSKSFKWKNSDLDLALLQRGQVHFEQEHAVIHAQALIAVSGGSIEVATETQPDNENEEQYIAPVELPNLKESDLTDHPQIVTVYGSDVKSEEVFESFKLAIQNLNSTETGETFLFQIKTDPVLSEDQVNSLVELIEKRKLTINSNQSDESDQSVDQSVLTDTAQKLINAIDKCESDYYLQAIERNLDSNAKKLSKSEFNELKQLVAQKRESFFEVTKPANSKTYDTYVQKINACNSQDELYQLNQAVIADDKLNIDQQEQLIELTHQKAEEIAPGAETEVEQPSLIDLIEDQAKSAVQDKIYKDAMSGNGQASYPVDMLYTKKKQMLISRIQEMDSIEALERLAPAIPAAKLNPEDHQELLQIYAERKTAMQHADA